MPGHGLRAHQLAHRAAQRLAVVVEHVDGHAEAGPAERHRADRLAPGAGDRKQAPTSVPPEMLMTGQRPPPTCSEYQRHGSSFHGSPVEARIRRRGQVVGGRARRRRGP